MQCGEQYFQGAFFGFLVFIDGNTADVIYNGDFVSLFDVDFDLVAVPVQRFVDGVVQNFPYQMMQALQRGRADIHSRPFTDRFQALQYLNVFRFITHEVWISLITFLFLDTKTPWPPRL